MFRNPMFYLALIAFTSIMMVSTVPTPSLKHVRMTRNVRIAIGMFLCLFVPSLIVLPWGTLSMSLALYLATIPLVIRGARIAARHDAEALRGGRMRCWRWTLTTMTARSRPFTADKPTHWPVANCACRIRTPRKVGDLRT